MTYAIEIERSALKEFAAIPKRDRERIYERLQQLSADPFAMAGVKKLSSQPGYRLRVGDYRVLYLVDGERVVVIVIGVGHRREVYR